VIQDKETGKEEEIELSEQEEKELVGFFYIFFFLNCALIAFENKFSRRSLLIQNATDLHSERLRCHNGKESPLLCCLG
jgi:hypothetical protein